MILQIFCNKHSHTDTLTTSVKVVFTIIIYMLFLIVIDKICTVKLAFRIVVLLIFSDKMTSVFSKFIKTRQDQNVAMSNSTVNIYRIWILSRCIGFCWNDNFIVFDFVVNRFVIFSDLQLRKIKVRWNGYIDIFTAEQYKIFSRNIDKAIA